MKLTEQEELRIKELKQIGFEVVDSGIRNKHSVSGVSACYWRYMRGNRVSALHPNPAVAWRDAIREWDTVSRATAGKGIHVHSAPPVKEDVFTVPIKEMKTVLEAAGYTFTEVGGWFLPSMERKLLGDEKAAVRNAWFHCVSKGTTV